MNNIFSTLIRRSAAACILALSLSSCESVFDDGLPECRTQHRLTFIYDYNMKFADAFNSEVNSVNVWAFDRHGTPVWKSQASGEALRNKDFYIDIPLEPGNYDFVAWCGLDNNPGFSLLSDSPASPSALGIELLLQGATKAGNQPTLFSDTKLSGLYHALAENVEITYNPDANETRTVQLSLVKDTKYVKVLLQNLDGKEMGKDDFSIFITADNSQLAFDNDVISGTPVFRYDPWMISSGQASTPGADGGTTTSVSSVLAEMSTSRLMEDAESFLTVIRNSDGKEIIRIPFIQYLLLVKGNYRPMGNQEYLDRQDEYSMTFFIDKGMNWYSNIGIYINSWHVVPKQDTPLH
ncbi:MAG: FimB/Mfa2 family fimbrial subunit [Muribaculaceae bacterium]|nr:FimB/Mfa2 family fimbrial subunit [Muribaculaceae bacterium]